VADPFRAGHELPEHRPAGVERLVGIDLRAIEHFGWVAARIGQLGQAQNAPLPGFGIAG
jgi:hypothetical protein